MDVRREEDGQLGAGAGMRVKADMRVKAENPVTGLVSADRPAVLRVSEYIRDRAH